ncbi:alpha-L-rhamnosidase C-terminal domain-containing protein [Lentisphaerota bacterium WC36G]|nr:glycoside hydrolase [Lentisphaerae bacterium WC36]
MKLKETLKNLSYSIISLIAFDCGASSAVKVQLVEDKTTMSYSLAGDFDYNWGSAKWIGVADSKQLIKPNTWYNYRYDFMLNNIAKSAVARISCDSKYWLWINEKLVVVEGTLRRGPTPKDTYYDVVDLERYLSKGKNKIEILQNYWGRHGFSHNSSGKAGLIFSLDLNNGEAFVNSNKEWLGAVDYRYGNYKNDHKNFRLPERSIDYDPTKSCKMALVQELGAANSAPWGKLVKRPIPLLKDFGLKNYVRIETETKDNKKIIKAYLPHNMTVNPYFELQNSTDKGSVTIGTDNKFNAIEYNFHLQTGLNKFEGLNYISGHYVVYEMPKSVEVKALKFRQVGYDNKLVGFFKCDDSVINSLWDKAEKSLYINMRDSYTDCPDREKAQWWGDLVNEMTESFYVYDFKNTPQLAKKGIYELANWQRFDNVLYSPIPAGLPEQIKNKTGVKCNQNNGEWSRELPHQMLTSIGYYGFYTYYLYSGDKKTIKNIYDNVKRYLSIWKIDTQTGLVVKRKGGWYWADWGSNKDDYVQLNAFYYAALDGAIRMAKVVGANADIANYQAQRASIKKNFDKYFWNGREYRSKDYQGKTDDRANAIAVDVGLAKKENYDKITKVLTTQFNASPYMEKYVLEALFKMHRSKEAIVRMKKRWMPQINSKFTTLSEFWEVGAKGGTYNHGWSGGGLLMMYQYIAGIRPLEAGFEKFIVQPQIGNLKKIEAGFQTKYGMIYFVLDKENKQLKLVVPANTSAELDLSLIGFDNSSKVTAVLHEKKKTKNINFLVKEKQVLTSGSWIIAVK